VAMSASTRDLARAASVATRDAAISAASLERLRTDSVSRAEAYLDEEGSTGSSRGSRGKTFLQ
jgi:hypothetical protein